MNWQCGNDEGGYHRRRVSHFFDGFLALKSGFSGIEKWLLGGGIAALLNEVLEFQDDLSETLIGLKIFVGGDHFRGRENAVKIWPDLP